MVKSGESTTYSVDSVATAAGQSLYSVLDEPDQVAKERQTNYHVAPGGDIQQH